VGDVPGLLLQHRFSASNDLEALSLKLPNLLKQYLFYRGATVTLAADNGQEGSLGRRRDESQSWFAIQHEYVRHTGNRCQTSHLQSLSTINKESSAWESPILPQWRTSHLKEYKMIHVALILDQSQWPRLL